MARMTRLVGWPEMARPTRFTPETVHAILTGIRVGLSYDLACQAAGVSFETFRQWRLGKFPSLCRTESFVSVGPRGLGTVVLALPYNLLRPIDILLYLSVTDRWIDG